MLLNNEQIKIYTQHSIAQEWLGRYQGKLPIFACVLGFTATGLIPGISAAGATPEDRKYTAIADAEFLVNGVRKSPSYPLPPLTVGVSPVFITRSVIEACHFPVYIFDAGLPQPPTIPTINLGGVPAACLTSAQALPKEKVQQLLAAGLNWGGKLAQQIPESYLIISECVVGGTSTALALLTGLGIAATGKVNSSHPHCNHQQKWEVVVKGLKKAGFFPPFSGSDPLDLVAAVGDPMQIFTAGMAIAASRSRGVLLAGGTQMLAVHGLIQAIVTYHKLAVDLKQIVVGTTRWVAEDLTGDTVGLAKEVGKVPLLATQLNFAHSQFPQLQSYENSYVKEGVGAGGSAIAAWLYARLTQTQLLEAIEALVESYSANC
ncbi:MAG: TIGR00303 family protein [Spirulinaceae cyanobacterium]